MKGCDNSMIKYGDRLRSLREGYGLSQKELADRMKINRSTYARYETSSTQPDYDILNALADFYNVSVDYILGRTNNNQLQSKDERDIAKRLEQVRKDLENSDGLAFDGEPMSEEAKESLLESMELLFRQTQRINKKYTPKKYLEDE